MSQTSIDSAGASEGTFKSYTIGFVLSIVLTAIAFALVIYNILSIPATIIAIFSAAVLQIMVHLYYFLHVNTSSKARWNVLALLLAVLIMILIIGGTIWIMLHLNYRLI